MQRERIGKDTVLFDALVQNHDLPFSHHTFIIQKEKDFDKLYHARRLLCCTEQLEARSTVDQMTESKRLQEAGTQIDTWIKKEQEPLIALRRWFHIYPEPSMKGYETVAKIEEGLARVGVAHRRTRGTRVFASISGKKGSGKVLVSRTDMDTLSTEGLLDKSYRSASFEYTHACGHDARVAVLLHAMKLLQERRHEFAGEIRFFFQPGEEIGQGARTFIGEGYLDGVDRVFGAHVCSSLDVETISLAPGPINASRDYFRIVVQGRGAYVPTPQKGVDALYIVSQIVMNLQSVASRSLSPLDTTVAGIDTLHAGTQYNIVVKKVLLEGITYSFSSRTRTYINQRVCEITYQAASLYGGSTQVELRDFTAPLINNSQVVEKLTPATQAVVGKGRVIHNQEKMIQADDFTDYLAHMPGCYAFIGSGNSQSHHTGISRHHTQFDIDESTVLLSLAVFVGYTLQYLA